MIEFFRAKVITQTDHSVILDILQQSCIRAMSSTTCMNVCLVLESQFFCQFRLGVRHKPGREYTVPDVLSRLASKNENHSWSGDDYLKLDALFLYFTILVDINPELLERIMREYKADVWWSRL